MKLLGINIDLLSLLMELGVTDNWNVSMRSSPSCSGWSCSLLSRTLIRMWTNKQTDSAQWLWQGLGGLKLLFPFAKSARNILADFFVFLFFYLNYFFHIRAFKNMKTVLIRGGVDETILHTKWKPGLFQTLQCTTENCCFNQISVYAVNIDLLIRTSTTVAENISDLMPTQYECEERLTRMSGKLG